MKGVLSAINSDPEILKNHTPGFISNFPVLHEAPMKTKTIIDDGIISLVLEEVIESAKADNILL